MEHQKAIPFYNEINDFLASIPSGYRTNNPMFYCLRLKENDLSLSNYKPPYRKGFYFMALVTNAGQTKITYDNTNVSQLNSFLVFQSPGLIYSFHRDDSAKGYLVYFKKECFSFFKPDFDSEFPFFNVLNTNFFSLSQDKYQEFSPYFDDVFLEYEKSTPNNYNIAALKLLTLLYHFKAFTNYFKQWEEGFTSPQQVLFHKYKQIVNSYYLEYRLVEDYARLLAITPNYLSQTIKEVSGKNALSYINERILMEAKSLIRYTHFDMAEIAYQLNFSDPANFGKFFKKHTGLTPLEFRKKNTS